MKDFLSKGHYCYKIYTLLMKILIPPSIIFQNSQLSINKGVHTMNITYDLLKQSQS